MNGRGRLKLINLVFLTKISFMGYNFAIEFDHISNLFTRKLGMIFLEICSME